MPETAPIRTFLAVELPPALKTRLGSLEREFAGHGSILKWVRADLIHITVRFLGNVAAAQLGSIEEAARRSAADIEAFSLHLSGLGAFPTERTPRVVWVGLREDAGLRSLQRLHEHIEEELARIGFQREDRRFSPHLTLARTREEASSVDRRALGETLMRVRAAHDVSGEWAVEALVVMRSELSRAGPTYTPLARVPLGEAG